MNRWSALALILAIGVATALRLPRLDTRPLHNDEAVNAVKVADLWEHGRYRYDPDEYHGPTLHYASLPFLYLSGARSTDDLDDSTLRLTTVAFGVALILLLPLFADGLGRAAIAWAAIFTALSPAMVFYSRYFIHEILLLFFTVLALGAGWRYLQRPGPGWALLAGASVGLMFATKETFVLTLAAMGLALVISLIRHVLVEKRVPPHPGPLPQGEGELGSASGTTVQNWLGYVLPLPAGEGRGEGRRAFQIHCLLAFSATLLIWLLLFSSFFTHFGGLADSIRTYLPWLKRAGGRSPHIHPWYFYFQRLAWFHARKGPIWSEGFVLTLGLFGTAISLTGRRGPLPRFLACYTIVLTAIYTAISYKTPWCLLSFYFGIILMAGVGAATMLEQIRIKPGRIALSVILIGFSAQLGWQAWRASFVYPSDQRNPYVYAQTVPDLLNLVKRAEGIAAVAPSGHDTVVKVVAPQDDYWPLPWYLRRFKHIGWYDKVPADPFAPVIIVASKLNARLDEKSDRKWIMAGITEMRPGKFFELYVELELWKKYVTTLPRERD